MLFYLVVPLGLEEGVAAAAAAAAAVAAAAAAATAAVSAVGLAGDGHAPLHGVPRGQVLELGHDLTTADLLRDVLGLAVRLGHAVKGDAGNDQILRMRTLSVGDMYP